MDKSKSELHQVVQAKFDEFEKFDVCLGNGSKYVIEARDEREAYLMATEHEIQSLRKEFDHCQEHGRNAAYAVKRPHDEDEAS